MNGLERKVLTFMERQGWDVDYKEGVVTNAFGEDYIVKVEQSPDCFASLGYTNLNEDTIVLREPCTEYIDFAVAENKEELMAHVLAHEVGHTEAHPFTMVAPSAVLVAGMYYAMKEQSLKPMKYAIFGAVGFLLFANELIAEGCASYFHDVPFLKSFYLTAPTSGGLKDFIFEGFKFLS